MSLNLPKNKKVLRTVTALSAAMVCSSSVCHAQATTITSPDIPWLGVNASYYPNLQRDLNQWKLKTIRLNWGWHSPDVPDGADARFYSPEKLRTFVNDGFRLVAILNPRATGWDGNKLENTDFEVWVENYKNYCHQVIRRYSAPDNVLIASYLCGNETDLSEPSTGNLTPYQAVRFTRALWEAKNEVNRAVVVESSPVSRPDTPYLREMIEMGVANWCDVIGIHAYSDQLNDANFRAPWDYLRAVGHKKAISISEAGVPLRTDWGPKSLSDVAWRERWHSLAYLQAKRFGYSQFLLFTHTGGDAWTDQWAYVERHTKAAIPTAYDTVKTDMVKRAFSNGSFESANNIRREWVPVHPINAPDEPTWADFAFATARSGQRSLKIRNGMESRYVKRVVPDLKIGRRYVIKAWTKVSPRGTAILAAQGFNRTDGLDERSARAVFNGKGDGWQLLQVSFKPTNPWVVISLGAAPAASGQTLWDDVTISPE